MSQHYVPRQSCIECESGWNAQTVLSLSVHRSRAKNQWSVVTADAESAPKTLHRFHHYPAKAWSYPTPCAWPWQEHIHHSRSAVAMLITRDSFIHHASSIGSVHFPKKRGVTCNGLSLVLPTNTTTDKYPQRTEQEKFLCISHLRSFRSPLVFYPSPLLISLFTVHLYLSQIKPELTNFPNADLKERRKTKSQKHSWLIDYSSVLLLALSQSNAGCLWQIF